MSLLSNTQGRPERVRSLVGLLSAHGGTMPREEVYDWLLPRPFRNRDQVPTSIQNTIGAASDLGLVETFRDRLVLVHPHVPTSEDALSDYCHDFLCTTEKQEDRVLLDAFAYFVVRSEQHGSTDWIESNRQVADEVNDVLMKQASEDDERRFNDTKIAPWKSWMTYLGLGWEAPSLPTFYPSVTERLQRVVRGRREWCSALIGRSMRPPSCASSPAECPTWTGASDSAPSAIRSRSVRREPRGS